MIYIGVDPHKNSHTAAALAAGDPSPIATIRVPSTASGYLQLREWGQRFDERTWAVENARGLGHHLSQWLIGAGEQVVDVPATASARIRELSRGRGRKTDPVDAAAVAVVASHELEATTVHPETGRDVLGLLDERRDNLARQRVRVVNHLHALLMDLLPGGAGQTDDDRPRRALAGYRRGR
jgi:hypothetical protein